MTFWVTHARTDGLSHGIYTLREQALRWISLTSLSVPLSILMIHSRDKVELRYISHKRLHSSVNRLVHPSRHPPPYVPGSHVRIGRKVSRLRRVCAMRLSVPPLSSSKHCH